MTTVFDAKIKVARLLARDAAHGRCSATDAVAALADAATWNPRRDVLGRNPLIGDAFEEGKHKRDKGGQFTSGAAAQGAKNPDNFAVRETRKTTHLGENGEKTPATTYHLRGRYRQNMGKHHRVTLENGTGRILEHHVAHEQVYQTIHGERSREDHNGDIGPARSAKHKDVHGAIQEHLEDEKRRAAK